MKSRWLPLVVGLSPLWAAGYGYLLTHLFGG